MNNLPCECLTYCVTDWVQSVQMQITGHHPRCPARNADRDNATVITALALALENLVRGCVEWGAQEDGLPGVIGESGVDIFDTVKMAAKMLCLKDLKFEEDNHD